MQENKTQCKLVLYEYQQYADREGEKMPGEMDLKIGKLADKITMKLSGEVDIYTSQGLKEKLYEVVESNKADLVIDCTDLNYIDSSGLGILIGTLKKAKSYGRNVYLNNMKDNIRKLFSITGLDKLFIVN